MWIEKLKGLWVQRNWQLLKSKEVVSYLKKKGNRVITINTSVIWLEITLPVCDLKNVTLPTRGLLRLSSLLAKYCKKLSLLLI